MQVRATGPSLPTAPLQLDAVVIALDRRAVHPAGVIQLRQSAFPLAAQGVDAAVQELEGIDHRSG